MSHDLERAPGADHYFTADPASGAEVRNRDVVLAGQRVRVLTAGGIFSPGGVDRGTAVLLKHVPQPPIGGVFLDLGCGWGPLALTMAMMSAQAQIHAIDVNRRAIDLMRRNAEALGCRGLTAGEPSDVADTVRFDLIWSNPAIRIGKAALHEMLLTWLPRLTQGGSAYLVVSKNLGADSLQTWLTSQDSQWTVQRYASDKGFRVLRVQR